MFSSHFKNFIAINYVSVVVTFYLLAMCLHTYALVALLTRIDTCTVLYSVHPLASGFREAFWSPLPLIRGGRSLKGGVPLTSPLALLRSKDPTKVPRWT